MKIRQSERDRAKLCPTSRSGTSPYRQSAEFFYFLPPFLHFRLVPVWFLPAQRSQSLAGDTPHPVRAISVGLEGTLLCHSPSRLLAEGWGSGNRTQGTTTELAAHPAHPVPKTGLLQPCPSWYMLSKPTLKGLYSSPGNLTQVFIFLCL